MPWSASIDEYLWFIGFCHMKTSRRFTTFGMFCLLLFYKVNCSSIGQRLPIRHKRRRQGRTKSQNREWCWSGSIYPSFRCIVCHSSGIWRGWIYWDRASRPTTYNRPSLQHFVRNWDRGRIELLIAWFLHKVTGMMVLWSDFTSVCPFISWLLVRTWCCILPFWIAMCLFGN